MKNGITPCHGYIVVPKQGLADYVVSLLCLMAGADCMVVKANQGRITVDIEPVNTPKKLLKNGTRYGIYLIRLKG